MILHVLMVFTALKIVNCENTMMVVWGKPLSYSNAQINKTLNWDECVEACFASSSCVIAYYNSTACYRIPYIGSPTVKKTNSSDGNVVAFKVKTGENGEAGSVDTCPIETDAPTFNGTNAPGYLYDTENGFPRTVYYNISLSESTWKVNYQYTPMCTNSFNDATDSDDGNLYCFAVLFSNITVGGFYNTAVETCKLSGGTLPTINSEKQNYWYRYLVDWFAKQGSFKLPNFGVRIDGIRKKECQATPTSDVCKSPEGFNFTDPNFLGTFDHYNFASDAFERTEKDDDCMVALYPTQNSNYMEISVRSCSTLGSVQALGLMCARKAWSFPYYTT